MEIYTKSNGKEYIVIVICLLLAYYDNTTIVIAGDHLTMQSNFFELEEGQDYQKKVVNLIINPAVEAENTKH